ncbi:unnamed protein product [Ilex paraguariensis]|uniref:Uncharacterized protein n=1 Tax=Ilex paraguariensis TaxID=185542 RepID=A0ABC8V1V4_9AQUA
MDSNTNPKTKTSLEMQLVKRNDNMVLRKFLQYEPHIYNRKGCLTKVCPDKDAAEDQSLDIYLRCGNSGHNIVSCSNEYISDDLRFPAIPVGILAIWVLNVKLFWLGSAAQGSLNNDYPAFICVETLDVVLQFLENSPFLEKLKKKGYEVLYMVDAIDEYAVGQL